MEGLAHVSRKSASLFDPNFPKPKRFCSIQQFNRTGRVNGSALWFTLEKVTVGSDTNSLESEQTIQVHLGELYFTNCDSCINKASIL
jgi:hypothetical protein